MGKGDIVKIKLFSILIILFLFVNCTNEKNKNSKNLDSNTSSAKEEIISKNVDNNLAELDLKGKVRSIKRYSYEVSSKFGEIIKGRVIEAKESFYNPEGNKTEIIEYDDNGKLTQKDEFSYNSQNLIKISIETNLQFDIKDTLSYNYSYYKPDKIKEIKILKSNGSLKNKILYNEQDYVKEDIVYRANGKPFIGNSYLYDSTGNKIEMKRTYYRKDIRTSKIEFSYNKNNNIAKQTEYKQDGSILKTIIYEYDTKGNVVKEIPSSTHYVNDNLEIVEDKSKVTYTYKYEFDSKHNWLKKITYINDMPTNMDIRTIEYY